jgi:hypothetical protein
MRVPLFRSSRDNRPIEPWEYWFAPVYILLMMLMVCGTLGLILAGEAVGLFGMLCWAIVSPVLPQAWRFNLNKIRKPKQLISTNCPECQVPMELEPINERGYFAGVFNDREVFVKTQAASCPHCKKEFSRQLLGKQWRRWDEQREKVPELPGPISAPGSES